MDEFSGNIYDDGSIIEDILLCIGGCHRLPIPRQSSLSHIVIPMVFRDWGKDYRVGP